LIFVSSQSLWESRYYSGNPRPSDSNAISLFNSLPPSVYNGTFYCYKTVDPWTNLQNVKVCPSGSTKDIGYHMSASFSITYTATFYFRFGADLGYGGIFYVDGIKLQSRWTDMWWGGVWDDPTKILTGSILLQPGLHAIEIYGFENCCDGKQSIEYDDTSGGNNWKPLSKANLGIVPPTPTVLSTGSLNGPTSGGTILSLNGYFFGDSGGTITVGGKSCVVQGTSQGIWSNTLIKCYTPAGQGLNQPIIISSLRYGTVTSAVTFSYDAPTISQIQGIGGGDLKTSGDTLTITGTNLGNIGGVNVRIAGGKPNPPGANNLTIISISTDGSQLICSIGAGAGQNLFVTVNVGGQQVSSLISYLKPAITAAITPQNKPTSGLNIDGTQVIIKIFVSYPGPNPTVTINSIDCPVVSSFDSTTNPLTSYINCKLPPGIGINLAVAINAGDQIVSSAAYQYSYGSPILNLPQPSGLLFQTCQTNGYTTPSNTVLCQVTLSGYSFGQNNPSGIPPTLTGMLGDQPITIISNNHTSVTFNIPPGIGKSVSLTFTAPGGLTSNMLTFNYLPPVITSLTWSGIAGVATTQGNYLLTVQGNNL